MARQPADLPIPSAHTLGLLTLGAAAIAGGAYLARTLLRRKPVSGHAAPDLALDQPRPGSAGRAPDAFRPDPAAPVPESEREALRPATSPAQGTPTVRPGST